MSSKIMVEILNQVSDLCYRVRRPKAHVELEGTVSHRRICHRLGITLSEATSHRILEVHVHR